MVKMYYIQEDDATNFMFKKARVFKIFLHVL